MLFGAWSIDLNMKMDVKEMMFWQFSPSTFGEGDTPLVFL